MVQRHRLVNTVKQETHQPKLHFENKSITQYKVNQQSLKIKQHLTSICQVSKIGQRDRFVNTIEIPDCSHPDCSLSDCSIPDCSLSSTINENQ